MSLGPVTPHEQQAISLQERRPGASRVHFEGNRAISRDDLLGVLHFPATGPYATDQLDNDGLYIQALYYDRGYIAVKVTAKRTGADAVTFQIEEGARFRIGKLEVREVDANGSPVPPLDGMPARAHFRSKPGDWFSRRALVDDLDALRRIYQDAGYGLVEIEPLTEIDPQGTFIDITIPKIDLGPEVVIDRVEVLGSQIPTERVLAEIDIPRGSRYNATKLERARKRLLAIGWYDEVWVSVSEMTRDHPRAVIKVEVRPRR